VFGEFEFQSAPHFSSEANSSYLAQNRPCCSFNPRLTSAARRTDGDQATHLSDSVSIRASLQQRGERMTIRPRLVLKLRMFQSAPHFSSEANAMYLAIRADLKSFNPRLTSAARRTQRKSDNRKRSSVSIRASLQQRGERAIAQAFSVSGISFNPRLTSAARRTRLVASGNLQPQVSIRASLQQRGERAAHVQSGGAPRFQSAPHFSSEANEL